MMMMLMIIITIIIITIMLLEVALLFQKLGRDFELLKIIYEIAQSLPLHIYTHTHAHKGNRVCVRERVCV